MELKSKITFNIDNQKCEFKSLQESHVSKNYIQSLKKQEYIKMTSPEINEDFQRNYIKQIQLKKNNFINGIFVNDVFIGTSGVQLENRFYDLFESTNDQIGLIGILLFDKNFLGKGFGKILVWASSYLFNKSLGVKFFGAGMKKSNLSSLYSFKSCGFEIGNEDNDSYKVILNSKELHQPEKISNLRYFSESFE